MIALYGPLLQNPAFNLVVSGINRGDNCGLHVIYSGTVGAAREAACKVGAPSAGPRKRCQQRILGSEAGQQLGSWRSAAG
jgi:5'/3'-nucleotidase SurE